MKLVQISHWIDGTDAAPVGDWYLSNQIDVHMLQLICQMLWYSYFKNLIYMQQRANALKKGENIITNKSMEKGWRIKKLYRQNSQKEKLL